jgi:lysozyme family protein
MTAQIPPFPPPATSEKRSAQNLLWSFIASQEGDTLSTDSHDTGNWTSGVCGIGALVGSKYGISAASFPHEDISAMTYERAGEICMMQYWPAVQGDLLMTLNAPAVAMVLTDAAWISGPVAAISGLQRVLHLRVDGAMGPQTKAALQRALSTEPLWSLASGQACLVADLLADRIVFESGLAVWERYKGGWVHRVTRLGSLVHTFL